MKKKQVILAVIGGVVLLFAVSLGVSYNQLATSSNEVDSSFSQVENVMQRRADLIPNLVNAVKGSMKHEEKIFGKIADSRKTYNEAKTPQEKASADVELAKNVSVLVNAVHENYPQLASNENIKTLMIQLEGAENRISVERRRWNEAVKEYNQSVVKFPKNMVVSLFGFKKKEFFKAEEKAKTVPSVQFEENSK